jgi:hypothetical protein
MEEEALLFVGKWALSCLAGCPQQPSVYVMWPVCNCGCGCVSVVPQALAASSGMPDTQGHLDIRLAYSQ